MRPEDMTREQLLEIVRRLPVSADGVPIAPEMELYVVPKGFPIVYEAATFTRYEWDFKTPSIEVKIKDGGHYSSFGVDRLYSTCEAAERAAREGEAKGVSDGN